MNTSFEPKIQASTQHNSKRENQNTKAYPSRTIVHAKLEMTEPGDHDEREADAVANTIVSGGKIARKISSSGSSSGIAVSQQMESQLSQLQGGGRPMPQGLLNMMESGFGQDFGQVRIHTGAEATDMSSSIGARAFTLGNDIYFNRGQFSPETTEGQRLVAHELTHVAQRSGKVGRKGEKVLYKDLYKDPNNKQSSDELKNEKALAKKMLSRSIMVLNLMNTEKKYLTLFYYCFDRKSYNAVINNNNDGIASENDTNKRIETVRGNYIKMLDVLNSDDMFNDKTKNQKTKILFVKETNYANWKTNVVEKHAFDEGVDTDKMGGFATHYDDADTNKVDDNKIYLNYTSLGSLRYIKSKDNPESNKWVYQLNTASMIIHELSHRICGTDDFSYLGTADSRKKISFHKTNGSVDKKSKKTIDSDIDDNKSDYLLRNASSYEYFTKWVESTIYSVYDDDVDDYKKIDDFEHKYSTQGGIGSSGTWFNDTTHFSYDGAPHLLGEQK